MTVMKQNAKRHFKTDVKRNNVAALNAERRRNEALHVDEIAAFYAAHPELKR